MERTFRFMQVQGLFFLFCCGIFLLRRHSSKPNMMEKKNILTADFLDLLFEGRNKDYGAYALRKTYHRRILYAMAGTTFICLLLVAGSIWAHAKKKGNTVLVVGPTVVLENFKKEDPKPEELKPLPKTEPPKLATIQYVVPKIVKDDQVTPEDEVKEVDALADTKIGTMNQDGAKDDNIVAPVVEKTGTGKVAEPKVDDEDYNKVFTIVQIAASFKGGEEAWHRYLQRALNSDIPGSNGAPAGPYKVLVSFIVDKDGHISDVKAENDPGYGTKEEAIRVIRKGPDWVPAQQNGRNVIYRHRQAITFLVDAN